MRKCWKNAVLFGLGAGGYTLIELMFRGRTHWTMAVTGGVCAVGLYRIHRKMKRRSLFLRCGLGAALITAVEFAVGMLVNRMLHWHVWDYSDRFLNIKGQICPLFSLYWFLLNLPLAPLFAWLDRRVFAVKKAAGQTEMKA